jgi:hypothetical protein
LYIELIFVILFEEPDSFFVTVLLFLDFFLQGVDFIGEITLELFSLEFELFEFGSELLHQVILGDFLFPQLFQLILQSRYLLVQTVYCLV